MIVFPFGFIANARLTNKKHGYTLSCIEIKRGECMMEKVDLLVKGVPQGILTMFRGFCSIAGKSESEGVIDLMIEYIDKNTAGDKTNLKKITDEYRSAAKKKK
jgi:hypothetical protein